MSMPMRRLTVILGLLGLLSLPSAAQEDAREDVPAQSPSAAQQPRLDDNVEEQETIAETGPRQPQTATGEDEAEGQEESGEEGEEESEEGGLIDDIFVPSTQISEDLSVSFPVDI